MKKETEQKVDIDYADRVVPEEGKKGFVTMFMIMLGFTFFSASMWAGQQLAAGLDFWGFLKSLLFGGAILGLYTGLLGYAGAKTGMSMDLLAQKAFGEKGSYLSSAMISFTQIGWFGVGIAMFAIPVAGELFGDSKTAMWALVIGAGVCMTASAYFGIDSLTVISYIAVPLVAVLGTVTIGIAGNYSRREPGTDTGSRHSSGNGRTGKYRGWNEHKEKPCLHSLSDSYQRNGKWKQKSDLYRYCF